ncbi:MAG: response regulator transcription factor [Candidatus Peribacteria bacterium]|jgi:DNA-binding response OmpR family regulator|nr:response regulator transcription factor [Candidatus Peribacteria bacterium]
MTKILLVEDHQSLAKDIKDYLELEQGREVSTALDGEKGLMMAKLYDYDLILLDLMLPRLDGKSFCQSLRKEKTTPIIVITAKSQLEDKIDLFSLGADDYLVKPFHLEELLVRGKALLRRGSIAQQFQWKDFIIDFPSKKVKKVH